MQETTHTIQMSGLLLKEEGVWVAQGLEYDIAAQGRTIRDAISAFRRTMVGQMMLDLENGREPLAAVPKAPDFYWHLFFEDAEPFSRQPLNLPPGVMARAAEVQLKVA